MRQINAQTIPPPPQRLRVFDAMRGFAMLSVVFIHCLNSMNLGYDKTFPGEIIITYFMPLFFFISGFFAYKKEERWDMKYCIHYLSGKIKALIICPIFFYAISHIFKGNSPIDWLQKGFGEYWFVIALFVMAIIYMLLNIISKLFKCKIATIGMLFIGLLGLGILALHILHNENRILRIFEIANTCYFFQFYAVGILCKKYQYAFERLISKDALYSTALIIYITIIVLTQYGGVNESVTQILSSLVLPYLGTFLVVTLFYKKREIFETTGFASNWFCKIGSRTLDIYMIHYFFIPPLLILQGFLAPKTMILFQLIITGALTLVITQLSVMCSYLIRTSPFLAEWLLGVRPKALNKLT